MVFPPPLRRLCSFQVYWQQMTHFTSAQDDCFTTLPAASGLKRGYSGSNWWNNFYSCACNRPCLCNTQCLRLKTSWKPAKHLDVTWKGKTVLWPQAWLPWRGKTCHKMPWEVLWARHPQSWVGTSGKTKLIFTPTWAFQVCARQHCLNASLSMHRQTIFSCIGYNCLINREMKCFWGRLLSNFWLSGSSSLVLCLGRYHLWPVLVWFPKGTRVITLPVPH